jgi:hypothetical protein
VLKIVKEPPLEREAVEDAVDMLKIVYIKIQAARCAGNAPKSWLELQSEIRELATNPRLKLTSNPIPLNEGIYIIPASQEVMMLCRKAIALKLVR